MIKTSVDTLLKAKKRELENLEMQIVKHKNEIINLQAQIEHILLDIKDIKIPQNGEFSVFLDIQQKKRLLIADIDSIKQHISEIKGEIARLQEEHRMLNIECEKLKHIQENEISKRLKELKRREDKEIDEIALMLHNLESKKEAR